MRYKTIILVIILILFSEPLQAKGGKNLKHGKGWITGLAFSVNGERLYSSSFDGSIVSWNVETRKPIWKVDLDASKETRDYSTITHFSEIDLSLNEKVLAVTTSQTKVTKKLINGKIQTTGSKPTYSIMLFDTSNGEIIGNLTGYEYNINTVDFSPDGSLIVSASGDKEAKVWDIQTRKQVLSIPLTNAGRTAKFSPDSKTIAVSTVKLTYRDEDEINIGLYDAKTGKLIRSFPRSHFSAGEIDFSPEGRFLAVASNGKSLGFRVKETSKDKAEIKFVFSDTGQGQVDIWDLKENSEKPYVVFGGRQADSIAFSNNGLLAYGYKEGSKGIVVVRNIETKQIVHKFKVKKEATALDFSSDNRYLAIGGSKGKIYLFDLSKNHD